MSIIIKEMDSIENWAHLIKEYLTNVRKVSDEKQITDVVNSFAENLKEKKRFVVVAYKEEKPIGYLSGRPYGIVFETSSFYLQQEAVEANVGAQLVETLAKKTFGELGFKYFRQNIMLPFEFGLTFRKDLKKKDFMIFERCEMKIDPTKTKLDNYELHEDYSFEPFTKEKADEVISLMCKANVPGHPDLYIYPEMKEVEATKKVFAGITKNFEALDGALNPQIVKGKEIAGMSIVLRDSPKRAYIAEMAILPEHQRKGLGKNLLKRIIDECAKQDITDLLLAVSKDNIGAFKLYQKFGFEEFRQYLAITKAKEN